MRILLLRHAHTAAVGHLLVGRSPGVALSDRGRAQLEWIRRALRAYALDAVYSSPLERARETAEALASSRAIPVRLHPGLTEVDFGDWTGSTFEELAENAEWRRFNSHRGTASVPGGESAVAVQKRIVSAIESLRGSHRGATIAAVSHADVIRAAILHYLGMSLDDYHRIDIAPASVSGVSLFDNGAARVLFLNWSEALENAGDVRNARAG